MQALILALALAGTAAASELVITKTQFVDGVKATFPGSFCADQTWFRKCFSTAKDDCAKTMKTATSGCLEKMQAEMPQSFRQPADGQSWGEKLGGCIGDKFEEDLAKSKVKSTECEDISKWH